MADSPRGWTPPVVSEGSQTSSGPVVARESPQKLTRRMAPDEEVSEQAVTTGLAALQEESQKANRGATLIPLTPPANQRTRARQLQKQFHTMLTSLYSLFLTPKLPNKQKPQLPLL